MDCWKSWQDIQRVSDDERCEYNHLTCLWWLTYTRLWPDKGYTGWASPYNIARHYQIYLARFAHGVVSGKETDLCSSPAVHGDWRAVYPCYQSELHYAICWFSDWTPIQNDCSDKCIPCSGACYRWPIHRLESCGRAFGTTLVHRDSKSCGISGTLFQTFWVRLSDIHL
jgi:hypothetical protein